MQSQSWYFEKKLQAARQAHKLLQYEFVIWDTETTGIDHRRIVSIAAIDQSGKVLLDTRVNPQEPIPEGAIAIHGITDDLAVQAPPFAEIHEQVRAVLAGRRWVVYNLDFDVGALRVEEAIQLGFDDQRTGRIYPLMQQTRREALDAKHGAHCAMKLYAQFYGAFSTYHHSFTWQKLTNACEEFGIAVDTPPHSALGDCLRTLAVIQQMAAWLDHPFIQPYLEVQVA